MVVSHAAWLAAGGNSPVQTKTVTLTNAQILALPTTPVEIVAAPGANKLLVPTMAVLLLDSSAAAYTNYNAFSGTEPYASSVYLAWDALSHFNDALNPVTASSFLAQSGRMWALLGPVTSNIQSVAGDTSVGAGLVYTAAVHVDTQGYENKPLHVVGQNNDLGDFAGGNAANSLRVWVEYRVVDLA